MATAKALTWQEVDMKVEKSRLAFFFEQCSKAMAQNGVPPNEVSFKFGFDCDDHLLMTATGGGWIAESSYDQRANTVRTVYKRKK